MITSIDIRRRNFLLASAAVGGGLVLGFYVPFRGAEIAAAQDPPPTVQPNAWIRIDPAGLVTVLVAKAEMGQGVYTSMPMLIAEELEVDWNKIRVEAAPAAPVYKHTVFGIQVTGGSTSVASSWDQLRTVGASMRQMLIQAAANRWGVEASSCRAASGQVQHPASGRALGYGSLAEPAAQLPVPAQVALKEPKDFKLIGKSLPRLDTPEKINGSGRFGLDVHIPNMLIVLVARPPVFGGKVKSVNDQAAKKIPGVKAVAQVPTGIAVAATDFWSAQKGREALKIVWEDGEGAQLSTEGLRQQYAELAKSPGTVARQEGAPDQALADAAKQLTAIYEVPYLAHATMEPLNCVVELRGEECEIWTGTQFQGGDQNAVAAALGIKPEQVKINTMLLGGGFGRRANPHSDFVVEAAQVAKALQKPVKVIWTREDDMRGGYYRPTWYSKLAAGLDSAGKPVAWQHRIVGQSIIAGTAFEGALVQNGIDGTSVEGAAELPYAIPNLLVDLHSPKNVVPVQWWRSVGHSHTAFVVESFIDELAAASAQDPYEFRRTLLAKHPRHLGVLELVTKKAGWGQPLGSGRARGLAVHASFGSWVAQVAEVSVDNSGQINVHRVVCAVDCGRVVNPDTVKAQMESGIIYGLSAALFGEITLKEGRVEQSNFHDYPVVRLDESPDIEVHIVPSSEKPTGVGEPGTPPIAPAVANAVFTATGARLRRLPMIAERVKQALED